MLLWKKECLIFYSKDSDIFLSPIITSFQLASTMISIIGFATTHVTRIFLRSLSCLSCLGQHKHACLVFQIFEHYWNFLMHIVPGLYVQNVDIIMVIWNRNLVTHSPFIFVNTQTSLHIEFCAKASSCLPQYNKVQYRPAYAWYLILVTMRIFFNNFTWRT